jgi:hypothetical protein
MDSKSYPREINQKDDYTRIRCKISIFSQKNNIPFELFSRTEKIDLIKYGKILNIDLENNKYLYTYVLRAMISNLPVGWSEDLNKNGVIYFTDPLGNEYSRHPMDSFYKLLINKERKNKVVKNCTVM